MKLSSLITTTKKKIRNENFIQREEGREGASELIEEEKEYRKRKRRLLEIQKGRERREDSLREKDLLLHF